MPIVLRLIEAMEMGSQIFKTRQYKKEPRMREIAGVLCDLDGTLVNSEQFHVEAWNVIAERYGLMMPEGWDKEYVGKTDRYQAERMRLAFPFLPEPDTLLVERHSIYQNLLRHNVDRLVFPGVKEELGALRDLNFKLAVGSNSPMDNCTTALQVAGIESFFPVIVAFGMVREGKPAPDIYLEAARRIAAPPANCVVVEDTEVGLSSGKAAGCLAVGVTTTHPAEELKIADIIFATTAEALAWIGARKSGGNP